MSLVGQTNCVGLRTLCPKRLLVSSYFFWEDIFGQNVLLEGHSISTSSYLRGLWYKIAGLIHFLGTNQLARSVRHSLCKVHRTHSFHHVVTHRDVNIGSVSHAVPRRRYYI